MDPFKLGGIGAIGGGGGFPGLSSPFAMPGGAASARSLGSLPGMPPMSMEPLMGMMQQQEAFIGKMLQMLMQLMKNGGGGGFPGGGGGGGGFPGGGGGGYGGGGGGIAGSSGRVGDIINTGGGGSVTDSGPITPGTEGLLEHANRMVGLQENSDTAAIQAVTGKSGINPATTPWCAAWAMNLLEQHGVMNLDGLSNRNYCPTIKSWSQGKNTWGENGRYTPKPGDAILFDWNGDNNPDHIGIVERVQGGKVYTIEGNSSDSVKKNSYTLGSSQIDGYVRSQGKK